jgi:hypothetical protein
VFAESCVFGKQSLEPLYCNPVPLRLYGVTYAGHPFSRSYGAKLQSSLGSVLSRPLVYSTHLPVSVCGTDTLMTRYEAFLGSMGSARLWPCGLPITSRRLKWARGFANAPRLRAWTGYSRDPAVPTLLRPPFADNARPVVQEC